MTLTPDSVLAKVTEAIISRSRESRTRYIAQMERAARNGRSRQQLSCGNLAHGFAAAPLNDKLMLRSGGGANIAIVTAYNDMLSAHQPFATYPNLIKEAARHCGAVAQVAGGVPAMCDGVTQGQPGMELSLFSRDIIAQATAIALSHNMFDGALCLGVCDKIVPGMLIGALRFGHLPTVFVPAGPMTSGIPNKQKAEVRSRFAEGKASGAELLEAEAASYHSAGTCTFYGTANSNQMLMEFMGLHVPGAAFINPGTPLRDALTKAAVERVAENAQSGTAPLWRVVDEKAIVNAIVGLLATGGSTNHTIHLIAIARTAGILINWDDFDLLSRHTPLLARIYPNGGADVNQFHAAGGLAFVMRELLQAGLLHDDVQTIWGPGLGAYCRVPFLDGDSNLCWRDAAAAPLDDDIVRPVAQPFQPEGGIRTLSGNLGRAVVKISAVSPDQRFVEAPARLFDDQNALLTAFKAGELDRDLIAVVRFQGPRANGMPELHKLTPTLSVLQNRGFKVALVSDGRMSGASGKVAAAIHVSPEADMGGPLAKLRDGDIVRLDAEQGILEALVPADEWNARALAQRPQEDDFGMGRELFATNRMAVSTPETGAVSIY